MNVAVREATADDSPGVRRVLDAAMLEVRENLPARIDAEDVLVAEEGEVDRREADEDDRREVDGSDGRDASILGALVLVPRESAALAGNRREGHEHATHVDAVAVRRARRGRGVGSALVQMAAERHPRLTAEFDAKVRPFYEALGFEIAPVAGEDGRFRGIYEAED